MLIEYPNGKRKQVRDSVGRALVRIKGVKQVSEGDYRTRDMAHQPSVTKPMQAAPAHDAIAAQTGAANGDGLDTLDKEQLHALAKERGVKVHHMAGADKVRAALREVA